MAIISFDLGGTAVKYGIWDNNELMETSSFETPSTWAEMKVKLKEVVTMFLEKYQVSGVGISAPGAVDSENGIIGGISAIDYIHHFQILDELRTLFELPVSIENDANCAALAEVHYGAAKDVKNCYFLVIGTGIGGALIINKELIKGKHLFGGEVGYMLFDDEQTLSLLGSPVQLTATYQGQTNTNLSTPEIFDLAEKGDELASELVEKMYASLARGIYNISVSFDPDCILIGGGISKRGDIKARLEEKVIKLLKSTYADQIIPDIRICHYQNKANLIGAIAHFKQTYSSRPE